MLQAMALSVMPLEELRSAACEAAELSAALGEAPPLSEEDALAQEVLAWFKRDFFQWVSEAAFLSLFSDISSARLSLYDALAQELLAWFSATSSSG